MIYTIASTSKKKKVFEVGFPPFSFPTAEQTFNYIIDAAEKCLTLPKIVSATYKSLNEMYLSFMNPAGEIISMHLLISDDSAKTNFNEQLAAIFFEQDAERRRFRKVTSFQAVLDRWIQSGQFQYAHNEAIRKHEEMHKMYREFKELAAEKDIPIITASQIPTHKQKDDSGFIFFTDLPVDKICSVQDLPSLDDWQDHLAVTEDCETELLRPQQILDLTDSENYYELLNDVEWQRAMQDIFKK